MQGKWYLGDEGHSDACVGPDELKQHFSSDLTEDALDELLDEGIAHDDFFVFLQDLLHPVDFVVLIGVEKVRHRFDLRVVLKPGEKSTPNVGKGQDQTKIT